MIKWILLIIISFVMIPTVFAAWGEIGWGEGGWGGNSSLGTPSVEARGGTGGTAGTISRCGDNICGSDEDAISCPQDCTIGEQNQTGEPAEEPTEKQTTFVIQLREALGKLGNIFTPSEQSTIGERLSGTERLTGLEIGIVLTSIVLVILVLWLLGWSILWLAKTYS